MAAASIAALTVREASSAPSSGSMVAAMSQPGAPAASTIERATW